MALAIEIKQLRSSSTEIENAVIPLLIPKSGNELKT
jgi:hypothetical protein